MTMPRVLSALGGDGRQVYITKLFEEKGFEVRRFGIDPKTDTHVSIEDALCGTDFLLLPVPVTKDGYRLNSAEDILLMDLIGKIPSGCTVFAGKMPPYLKDHLRSKEIEFYDYYENKTYIWRNAEISAEGAIAMLASETEVTLDELKILICGYGRIGKCLAKKLKALGASVTVAARKKEDILQAEICEGTDTDTLDYCREGIFDLGRSYDVILNTVPSWIFDQKNSSLLKNAVYFELASAPHGGESEFLKKNCGKYILASGIPGKYAPQSAGTAAFHAICSYLDSEVNL